MNTLKKILGKILYGITQTISKILDIIIAIIAYIVMIVRTIAQGFGALIGMGGCLLLFLFAGPLGIYIIFNPYIMITILFFILFPILGTKFISFLKYIKYMLTEFLFDRANYLIYGTHSKFDSFFEYGDKYKKAEEAKRRREQQARQEQQRREWEARFKQWQEYQNAHRQYGSFGGYNYNTGSNNQSYRNPAIDFKKKYEESCDLLEIPYNTDKYQIKLAYRKKAKQYHPDLNKSPNATEMFQKINNAYEFLSESNIERYKNLG
ncbi:DnaJ domain-containing protein [Clostridium sp. D2Q-14]|uniref:J domain-containing protein n=1 Tax=Anaeromonas gelatinilytica TaxID=2683194 RepID=UPI00193C2918|nr:DnaJ domain-containing protein [Anaeromonas gelatinilytica]MBS4534912.1 DnaJ domain-containing protein [Anaeromonas gelatinilytica]